MTTYTTIGQPTPITDGRPKVLGAVRYAPDLTLPGMLYARFVTSPFAHAEITHIDTTAASEAAGVVTVLTAQDLPDIPPLHRYELLLARERVIFAGQPVALVLGTSEAAAQDGADLVLVDYNPLPVAITLTAALAEDAPLVWPDGMPGQSEEAAAHGAAVEGDDQKSTKLSNISNHLEFKRGEIETGFAEADATVEYTFTTSAMHQSYLEPQATLVQPDPITGGATIWTATQATFWTREVVAKVLDVTESDVQVIGTPVGGGFGGKFVLYQPLVALAAKIVGAPVKLVLTRQEELLAANPSLSATITVRLGAKKDGTLTALFADMQFDCGCFPGAPLGIGAILLGSIYQVPHLLIQGVEVVTFKPSYGAYRAPGAPQVTFALESCLDQLAEKLGLDPLEMRLKNASQPGQPMVHGPQWPKTGLIEVLEKVQTHPLWQERANIKAAGRGVGLAVGWWPGGTEPTSAICKLERDGTLHIQTSAIDLTGSMTSIALIAAETFGIAPDKVRTLVGDTSNTPFSGSTGGSKTIYMLGPAVIQAAEEAKQQVLSMAGEELEASVADLEIVDGKVQVKGVPDKGIPLGELAGKAMQFGGKYPPVYGHGRHAEVIPSPGVCAQLADVAVDQETGQVTVHKLVLIQDVGRAINPLTVEGQLMGGAVQGLGWALYEGMVYDEDGQLLTASWNDYTVPHFTQAGLEIETILIECPTDQGPLGARGVGEPPVIATAGAVANAIYHATNRRLTDLPMTAARVAG